MKRSTSARWQRGPMVPLLAGIVLLWSTEAQAAPVFRRIALIVGANNGGTGRTRLRYAHSDARAFAKVLVQLGGVKRGDLILMLNPSKMAMLGGIYKLRSKLKAAKKPGVRVEAVFYYSGHSDETGILLRGKRLTYKAIRTAIGDFPADLRIAILDSCASGALTRLKGGRRRPPFMVDKASDVRGKAFLTSASASEGAQESDRIKGSYFTHYLISGLRGAADKNRDGKVTLTEAYKYAFHQTLKRTQSSRAGPQHANYDFQLTGSGDLVLTDLRRITARLLLASRMSGRLYIRDHKGRLMAEVVKRPGKPMTIGLAAGKYTVLLSQSMRRYKHTLVIRKNGRLILTRSQMTVATASEAVILRGSGPGGAFGVDVSVRKRKPARRMPVNIGLLPWFSVNALVRGQAHNHFNLSFLCSRGVRLSGLDFTLGCSFWEDSAYGVQVATAFTRVAGDMRGIQISGGYGSALRTMTGLQLSGGLALAGRLRGLQISGGASLAFGHVNGLQLSGGLALAGRLRGLQISGGASLVLGQANGLQLSGGLSLATALRGVQISSINISKEKLNGLAIGAVNINLGDNGAGQIGAVNIAGDHRGLQISAVNVATGRMKGLQLGAVNYARKASGLQFGLVNITQEGDGLVPIGLINYVGNGILQPTFWSTGASVTNLGVKTGSKQVYGLVGVGMHPLTYEDETVVKDPRFSFIFGLGAHFDFKWWRMYLDVDLVTHRMGGGKRLEAKNPNYMNKLRVMLGFRLVRQLSIYAGPSLDLLVSRDVEKVGFASALIWRQKATDDHNVNLRMGLSFVLGIQYEPRFGKMNQFW